MVDRASGRAPVAADPVFGAAVHAVVVNWNSAEDTLRCLASLAASRPPIARVHVVDNGSTDGSVVRIRSVHPEVSILANDSNLGFAAAANRGIRAALDTGAAWVLLMNNDATLDAEAVARLLAAGAARPDAGLSR